MGRWQCMQDVWSFSNSASRGRLAGNWRVVLLQRADGSCLYRSGDASGTFSETFPATLFHRLVAESLQISETIPSAPASASRLLFRWPEIARASCRERV